MCKERPSFCVQVTILLELRYRSPLEGNEESDEDLEDDEEEFVPNVGLVSHKKAKAIESDPETNALISLEENIAKFQGGSDRVLGYFVGKCLKSTKGKGNPKLINKILLEKLKK